MKIKFRERPDPTFRRVDLPKPMFGKVRALPLPDTGHDPIKAARLEWHKPLLPYQIDGVKTLISLPNVLLADDMGLGKTIQAIAAVRLLCAEGALSQILLVVPASLTTQWAREWRAWAPEVSVVVVRGSASDRARLWKSTATVKIVGYEMARNEALSGPMHPIRQGPWDLIILDEASRIKNRDSDTSRALRSLDSKRRWALTGTPLENTIGDVMTILSFLRVRVYDQNVWQDIGDSLRKVQLRRRKSDVLPELPPKTIIDIALELGPRQMEAYQRAETEGVRKLKALGPDIPILSVLELIIRLKQICNRDPASGESAKLDDLGQRVPVLVDEGHRALVFSQFTDLQHGVGWLNEALNEFRPVLFTGALRQFSRQMVIDEFRSDHSRKLILLSLKAGGVGLNLQEASYVFHLDRWWNPAIEDQADSRSHRMGQPNPVTVYRYTCVNTIEERIAEKLEEKRQLFAEVVDDACLDVGKLFTRKEMLGLLGLNP